MRSVVRLIVSLAAVFCFVLPSPALAALDKPVEFTIIAQQPGSGLYNYATTLSRLLQDKLPEGSKITIAPRGASMVNPTVLDQGKAPFAFAAGAPAEWAWRGLEEVYGTYGPHKNIRYVSLGHLNDNYMVFVARKEYVDKTGNDTLEKLLNAKELPRVAMKPQGSVALPITNAMFSAIGKSLEDLRKAGKLIQTQPAQIGEMLRDGRVDAYFENCPSGHPAFTETSMTNELFYYPIPESMLEAGKAMGITPFTMKKGTFKGLEADYPSLGTPNVLLAHKDADPELVYIVTKTLNDNIEIMKKDNPGMDYWDPKTQNDRTGMSVPLHPGAERYYKEVGLIK